MGADPGRAPGRPRRGDQRRRDRLLQVVPLPEDQNRARRTAAARPRPRRRRDRRPRRPDRPRAGLHHRPAGRGHPRRALPLAHRHPVGPRPGRPHPRRRHRRPAGRPHPPLRVPRRHLAHNSVTRQCLSHALSDGKLDIVPQSPSRIRALAAGYPELIAVLAAAIVGLTVQRPLAWLAGHQGINVLLAILVFATAITIDPAALRRLVGAWRSLAVALIVGITVLPALSWAVSRIVAAGSLRDGVLVVGLAPCEIASVATTAMAGGEAAVSAGVLIGSTVTAVALAGPILTLEAGHAGVSPASIIANLALVVALPLALGLAARASADVPAPAPAEPPAQYRAQGSAR